ncbi:MAG: hypothetical protein QOG11_638 [Solirubrobacteraceae bacterium]|nr:hypothetical protein [Solirubrobacteraceae bacterium]
MELIFALTATKATIGIVVVFFVVFPLLVQGILAVIAAQVAGERAENERYAEGDLSG